MKVVVPLTFKDLFQWDDWGNKKKGFEIAFVFLQYNGIFVRML